MGDVVNNSVFLHYIALNHTISDVIFSSLTPTSLSRFARTCRAAHSAAKDYILRAFNINKHLKRYFPDPLAFRALQARTGTIISGSSALQFLDRSFYPESDLDLYAFKKQARAVGNFLRDIGYVFEPNSVQNPRYEVAMERAETQPSHMIALPPHILEDEDSWASDSHGVHTVFNFVKKNKEEKLKIQLIIASSSPMEIIYHFHSTCVMNIITYNSAHALFPRATFEFRRALVTRKPSKSVEKALDKYRERGWHIDYVLWRDADYDVDEEEAFDCIPSLRWMDGPETWTLPLPIVGISLLQAPSPSGSIGATPIVPAALSGFKVAESWDGRDRLELSCMTLQLPMLEYAYTFPHEHMGRLVSKQVINARAAAETNLGALFRGMSLTRTAREEKLDYLMPGFIDLMR